MKAPFSKMRRVNWILVCTLIVPTTLAILYYGLLASDVYISESRFVVRNPDRTSAPSGLGALLQTSGFSRSQDDTYSVHDYVMSRDALHELDGQLKVREIFSRPTIDVFNRFSSWGWERSFESFYLYFQKHVAVDYDSTSSITTLTVRAYSAKEAQQINDLLLRMSERLVNNLNDRSRQDLIQVAQQEVKRAADADNAAALALSSFRADRTVFDPTAQSALQLQSASKLQADLISTEAQLAQLRRVAPNNSQIAALTGYVETLKKAIANESGKVIGDKTSFASKAPVYDRLMVEKTFADKQLASSLASLEEARAEALRKQLYLERLVEPNLPDEAMEPRRIRSVFMVFLLGLMLWGVVSLVVASVKEHTD